MKLLLISANREPFPDPVFPLGLAYIAEAVRRQGHEIHVLDLAFSKSPIKDIARAVAEESPQAIAFSFRNLDNAAYPLTRFYLPDYQLLVQAAKDAGALSRKIKTPSGRPWLIAGGSAFSLMPRLMLNALGVDYGVEGEGEDAFPALLWALEEGLSPLDIPGVFGKEEPPLPIAFSSESFKGILAKSQKKYSFDGSTWSRMIPARDLFQLGRYGRVGGMANIQTKRGCVFHCRYCTYPVLEGSTHRLRDPESVADEIQEIVERDHIRSFFFVDSVFNIPTSHAEGVADALIRRNLKIRWSAYASPSGLTLPLLQKMATAGCDGLEVGSDSADKTTLVALGKGFSRDQILDVSENCRKAGIALCHSLIFGGPGETPETVENTCRTIDETKPMAVVVMAGVRLYPRTPMGDWALETGHVKEAKDFLEPVFYIDPSVKTFLLPYLEKFAAQRGNWILPGVVAPLRPITQRLIRFVGYKKPLWHLLRYGVFKDRVYRDR
ncbi:MAG: B12-binding domain-containing radical SAM protein [Leptospirillum sp.]